MKLFNLEPDFSKYKYYLLDEYSEGFREQSSKGVFFTPPQINLKLFQGETVKEKKRKDDFNISMFSDEIFVNKDLMDEMIFIEGIEFFKVNTDDDRNFYYLNTVNNLNVVLFQNDKELYNMVINRKYKFKTDIDLSGYYIFRDNNVPFEIFFTEEFVTLFSNKLKGANFIECL